MFLCRGAVYRGKVLCFGDRVLCFGGRVLCFGDRVLCFGARCCVSVTGYFVSGHECCILRQGTAFFGALAQLGAHHTGSVGVRGSNPLCSTNYFGCKQAHFHFRECACFFSLSAFVHYLFITDIKDYKKIFKV